ncbi:uridine diphosphate glucose pyrophosphatase NUDT14-like [Ptychodera flava]|uniref:uridine diphosphate glucose pyrophosphatase NUDT14-like n=1 Tax=Ptychodera flava TaxID=63121 RepID=UPI00396A77C7
MADNIKNVRVLPCAESKYIKPYRMHYQQNGVQKTWDYTNVHDSVVIMIFNVTRKVFVLVKQFRPAVYVSIVEVQDGSIDTDKYPGIRGITYELCAGIVDKKISLEEIAREEVLDETGYDVPLETLEKVSSYRSGVGTTGSLQTMFYVEVTDDMRTSQGGGLVDEGEMIDVIEIPLQESKQFIFDQTKSKPVGLMFAFMWFFEMKAKQFE